jgi:hypothetical protein
VDLRYLVERLNEELEKINRTILELEHQTAEPPHGPKYVRHWMRPHRRTAPPRTESGKEES